MADTGGWTTIESDPGLFTELIEAFGVRGVVVEELWALDADSLRQQLGPGGAHGLVFLFKYEQEHYGGGAGGQQQQQQHQQQQQQQEEAAQGGIGEVDVAAGAGAAQGGRVFFARQVIANACATQAILSVLLNRGKMGAGVGGGVGADGAGGLDLGPELTAFAEFTADFPPDLKGLAIGNSHLIRAQHNAFARPDPLLQDEKRKKEDNEGEAFHFVAYVPRGGTLWELDGLREGPIPLCEATDADWLDKIGPIMQARIDRFSASGEIRFNLMALAADPRPRLRAALACATARRVAALAAGAAPADAAGAEAEAAEALADAIEHAGSAAEAEAVRGQAAEAAAAAAAGVVEGSGSGSGGGGGDGGQGDAQEALLRRAAAAALSEAAEAREALARERARRESWRRENVRRRHNYVPLVFQVARLLAERGTLRGLLVQAEGRRREQQRQQRAKEEEEEGASKRQKAG